MEIYSEGNDITGDNPSNELLKRERDFVTAVLETAGILVVVLDRDGRIVRFNRASEKATGYSFEEVAGRYFWDLFITSEEVEPVKAEFEKFLNASTPREHESYWTCKDGSRHLISWSDTVLLNSSSQSKYVIATGLDITERKRAQDEITRNEARLESLLRISQQRTVSIQEFLDLALGEAIALTGSKIGYIYHYDEAKKEFTLNTWSKDVMEQCAITEQKTIYQLEKTGLWGEAVRQAKPIIDNDFQSPHPLKKGYPDGHAPLYRYMTLPVFIDEQIVGVVGVANKETDYDSSDVRQLTLLMDSAWKFIERKKAEEALHESDQRVRHKLDSILSPEGDIGDLELADIIDVQAMQSIMDGFYELSNFPMAIIDLKGEVLVGVGWQDICTKFHRVNPETCKYCIESDLHLTTGVLPGEFRLYKCKNNMWDIATPIMVGGQHVGNLFSGQFFFDDETPDYELFREQAKQYGFDEKEYIAALDNVRRMSRETVNRGMTFLIDLAALISKLSYGNIKLARSLSERDVLTESLKVTADRLNRSQEIAHLGSWELDLVKNQLSWSDEVYRIFGLQPQEFSATYEAFLDAVHPDDREAVDAAYSSSVRDGKSSYQIEHRVVRKATGEVRWVHEKCEHVRDETGEIIRSTGMVLDITDRKKKEAELQKLNRILQAHNHSSQVMMHATDESEYLKDVCKIIVEDCGHKMVWIGFAEDDKSKTVRPVAYAGFDEGYINRLDVTWTDTKRGRGPTGTAIRTGKPSICRNMLTDPAFEPWREEAIKRGYASSIVFPLMSDGKSLGAISIYSEEADSFSDDEAKLLAELAADLAYGITAIRLRAAHAKAEVQLRENYERERKIAETLQRSLLPPIDLALENFIITGRYQPALQEAEVGGDFYDLFTLSDGRQAFVMGDVSGKGLQAAVHTAMAKYMLRAYANKDTSPGYVLEQLNDAICDYTPDELFITIFYGILDQTSGTLTYVNAGHEEPLVYCSEAGEVEQLQITGRAVGILKDGDYIERRVKMSPGDVLLVYTDGISDARGSRGILGPDGLSEVFASNAQRNENEIVDAIYKAALEIADGNLRDDAAVLVLKAKE